MTARDKKSNKFVDTQSLFKREMAVIAEAREVMKNSGQDREQLARHFRALVFEYENLFKVAIRITRISDEYQMRFLKANEKIREQKKRLEETNREQIDLLKQLRDSNATKDKFFSIISHDLKNAFGSLKAGFEMLSVDVDGLEREKIKELAKYLRKTWQNMFDLLENLLQWSRIQMGRMSHRPENVDLNDLFDHVIEVLSGSINKKEIRIVTRFPGQLKVYADKNMLCSILQNVISNAIKFSYPGGKIDVGSKREDEAVFIRVQDHGVGMERKALDRLFRIDSQHTTLGTSMEKGTGLGLILSREFARQNFGDIQVESQKGIGTTVIVRLPATPPEHAPTTQEW